MTDMWVDLAPVLLAMMISPARTLALILLLHTPRSGTTAFAYVCGMVTSMVLQGAALGAAMSLVGLGADDRSGDLSTFIGALYLVGGLILLAGGFKFATAPSGGGSLGALLDRIENMGPSGAFKLGFGWLLASPKQWVFVLTAVAVIFAAELSPVSSLANFALFTVLVQLVYLVILAGNSIAADRVGRLLDIVFAWIRAHLKLIAVGLFVGFGIIFVIKGLASLTS